MIYTKVFITCFIAAGVLFLQNGSAFSGTDPEVSKDPGFIFWQLPSQIDSIGMSYVIKTANGRVIVVDGGMAADAPYLKSFLKPLGNKVEAWFISHSHNDHFDALKEILLQPEGLKIRRIYASMADEAWTAQYEPDGVKPLQDFNAAVRTAHQRITNLKLGSAWKIDGVRIEVLGVSNPEIHLNALNNSSVVLRVSDAKRSILFLGDLGVEGGEKLLRGKYANKIHANYVQMAHHGQNGVNEAFYQAVQPSYCMWPTPSWLWDNNSGKGKDSGPWQTLKVRAWMDKLNIKRHYISFKGLAEVD